MSPKEKDSAQALFILIFLGPLALSGWRNLFVYGEMSVMVAAYAFCMCAFSLFVFYASILELWRDRTLLNIRGCGFAFLYFSGILMAYGLLLLTMGNVPFKYDASKVSRLYSVTYLKYAAYFLIISATFLSVGQVMEKDPEAAKAVRDIAPTQAA
jgi:hypothetical protein